MEVCFKSVAQLTQLSLEYHLVPSRLRGDELELCLGRLPQSLAQILAVHVGVAEGQAAAVEGDHLGPVVEHCRPALSAGGAGAAGALLPVADGTGADGPLLFLGDPVLLRYPQHFVERLWCQVLAPIGAQLGRRLVFRRLAKVRYAFVCMTM